MFKSLTTSSDNVISPLSPVEQTLLIVLFTVENLIAFSCFSENKSPFNYLSEIDNMKVVSSLKKYCEYYIRKERRFI